MPIMKIKVLSKYSQIPNAIAQNKNLSYEAIGLFTALKSRPDNWKIIKENLFKDNCRQEKLNKLFKELRSLGYLKLVYVRSGGKIVNQVWWLTEDSNWFDPSWSFNSKTKIWVKVVEQGLSLNKGKQEPCKPVSTNKDNKNTYKNNNKYISCTIETKVSDDTTHIKGTSKQTYTEEFETAWGYYPKRLGSNSKKVAFKSWNARLKENVSIEDLTTSVRNYAYFCDKTDKLNTEFVMQACRFFGTNEEYKNFINMQVINEKQSGPIVKFDGYDAIKNIIEGFSDEEKHHSGW